MATKRLLICPFCDEDQARTWQGMTQHVRAKHPEKIQELKDNKAIYLEKFACDESGNPLVVDPAEPPTSPAPPAQEPPEPPAKEKVPEPAKEKGDPASDGGLFHRISTSIFG